VRFDRADGGKDVLPYSLWRDERGRLAWRWKAAHGMRALYGLERLATRPDAPVLLVEGEKAADAAANRFPAWVPMTWAGGSAALSKADWGPLLGRRVVVWPDADAPGRKAGAAALAGLRRCGVPCELVDLPGGLPEKWDLADPWPLGLDRITADRLLDQALGRIGDTVTWPFGYRMEPTGLWFDKYSDGKPTPIRLSGPFGIVGEARDPDGGEWSLVLRFKDPDGRAKQEVVGRSHLAASGGEVRARLSGAGLYISVRRGEADRFNAALAEVRAPKRLTLVDATGWVGEDRFVLPHNVVGKAGSEPVLFTGHAGAFHYGRAGALDRWRSEIAALACGNDLLMLALSIAFAGPLLRPLGVEGGGFHFRGPSSCGKTTLAFAAGSVWGGGGPLGSGHSWRATNNALETIARGSSETLLVLDELALVAPEEAGQAAYSLASGQAKGRARQDGSLRARAEWCVMLLSTGEIGLADHIRTSRRGDRAMAGQELRLLDISADAGVGRGVWQELHGRPGPAELSDEIKAACRNHYGHAGPAFLEHLVHDRAGAVAMVKDLMTSFLREAQLEGDTGQVYRGAHRFALAAAAGELAGAYGVAPWSEGAAFNAALAVFSRWASAFGRSAPREEQSVLQILSSAIEMQQARFARLDEDAPELAPDDSSAREARALSTLGYVHHYGAETFYLVHQAGWTEIFRGHDGVFAAKVVEKEGFLLRGEGKHLKRNKRVQGQPRRFYWVRASILGREGGDQ
jgi:uncharacterized protein (DUF927 family)